jgi:hypothetical protein
MVLTRELSLCLKKYLAFKLLNFQTGGSLGFQPRVWLLRAWPLPKEPKAGGREGALGFRVLTLCCLPFVKTKGPLKRE